MKKGKLFWLLAQFIYLFVPAIIGLTIFILSRIFHWKLWFSSWLIIGIYQIVWLAVCKLCKCAKETQK